MGQAENETKKNVIVLIHFNPTWNWEFQKNNKKIQKIKKALSWLHSKQKRDGTG